MTSFVWLAGEADAGPHSAALRAGFRLALLAQDEIIFLIDGEEQTSGFG